MRNDVLGTRETVLPENQQAHGYFQQALRSQNGLFYQTGHTCLPAKAEHTPPQLNGFVNRELDETNHLFSNSNQE